jgi:hypothetical protein
MALFRLLLAVLIGLAVATAPAGAALAFAKSPAKAAMDDCHSKGAKPCPDCDSKAKKAKCPGDGSKCCKLVGTVGVPLKVIGFVAAPEQPNDPHVPPGWSLQPQPPPPRS